MTEVPRRDLDTAPMSLVSDIAVEPLGGASTLEHAARDKVFIDVIHDGHWLPEEFLQDARGQGISLPSIQPDYVRERDWGACAVAERLTAALGVESYTRINVARVLMDFARFPGSTPSHADHLHRFAINYPFSLLLSYAQKKRVLEKYYDEVSKEFERRLRGRLVKVAIHTYDQYNASGTERPAMSIMTRSIGYQNESELPAGLFDPMYPDVLVEFTADRVLRDRISLTLEKNQIPVAHNYPYLLPEGSLEVRYMVWMFFRALQQAFEERHPETRENEVYTMVWAMLMDTNLRSSDSELLRSYLHMYRRPPIGREAVFDRAAVAYENVRVFCEQRDDVVDRYRYSPDRSSSIAIEVRKDLVCDLGPDGVPRSLRTENIELVADTLADAISTYFRDDRPTQHEPLHDLERHDPWYSA